jgi:hypothetical protein
VKGSGVKNSPLRLHVERDAVVLHSNSAGRGYGWSLGSKFLSVEGKRCWMRS